jgi:hypothetical protein
MFILGFSRYLEYKSLIENGKITIGLIKGNSYGASTSFAEYKFKPIKKNQFYFNRVQITKGIQVNYNSLEYLVIYDSLDITNNFMLLRKKEKRYPYGSDLNSKYKLDEILPSFWDFK